MQKTAIFNRNAEISVFLMRKLMRFDYPAEYRKNIPSGNFSDVLRCGIYQIKIFRKIGF